MVRNLLGTKKAKRNPYWACYHTDLYNFVHDGIEFRIIGCAVGASFAVLVAEQLFASGCQLLISVLRPQGGWCVATAGRLVCWCVRVLV